MTYILKNTHKTQNNCPKSYSGVGWIYKFTPWTYKGLHAGQHHRQSVPSQMDHYIGSCSGKETFPCLTLQHAYVSIDKAPPTACQLTHKASTANRWLGFLGQFSPDISTLIILVNNFRIYHINFIQNKQVKLDRICIDTQCRFKANLSNVMEILECLTSKHHEFWHIA